MENTSKMARTRKKATSLKIDFSGVETLGRFHEDGDYRLKIVEVTQEQGDKYPYLSWNCESVDDPVGARVYNNTSLSPQSLWNVKAMLEAVGIEVPDDELDIELEELKDLEFMGKVEMEPYEGKSRPRLVDFWPVDDSKSAKKGGKKSAKDDDEEEEDEKPARGKKSSKKAKVTEEAIGEMSQDELEDLVENLDLEVDLGEFRTLRKMQAAVIDAAQEAGAIEEADADEEEENEKPARSRRSSKKDDDEEDEKPARSRRSSKKDDEEEEEEEDEKPTTRRRRR